MFSSNEKIHVRRHRVALEIPCTEVLFGDLFLHSGMWWKLTYVERWFGDLEHDDIFRSDGQWFKMDRVGTMAIALVLSPNVPFGETVPDRLPPAFLPDTRVEQCAVQIVERASFGKPPKAT